MGKRKGGISENRNSDAVPPQTNNGSNNGGGGDKSESTILAIMMQYHIDDKNDVQFEDVAAEIGCHERNKGWRELWTSVKKKGYVEASTTCNKGFQLTQKGIDLAATDEYKEMLSFQPKTNEEHQERIKKRLKKSKSIEIFDLLQKHGSLTRYELAGIMGQKDRGHAFSYSLQELKKRKGLVEEDPTKAGKSKGKKLRLSDKAYLKPEYRPSEPELVILDTKTLAKAVADNATVKHPRKKAGGGSTATSGDKEQVKMESEEEEQVGQEEEGGNNKTKNKEKETVNKKESEEKEEDVEDVI